MTLIISIYYVYVSSKIVYIALVNWPFTLRVIHKRNYKETIDKSKHSYRKKKNSEHESSRCYPKLISIINFIHTKTIVHHII